MPEAGSPPRVVLVGLPNVGKSQIFNRLTGRYAVVANYPMTTVTLERRPAFLGGQRHEVVDTPGLYGLTVYSEEGREVRALLYRERPTVVVQCVDANRLKSSLSLTADLLELEVPLVVALNAVDETTRRGIEIDARRLADLLGVQVVTLVAEQGLGTGELKGAIAAARPGTRPRRYGDALEAAVARVGARLGPATPYPRRTALALLGGDPFLAAELAAGGHLEDPGALEAEVAAVRRDLKANPAAAAARVRNRWIDQTVAEVVHVRPALSGRGARVAEALSRHPLFGLPVLAGLLVACFLLVVNVANRLADAMNEGLWQPAEAFLSGWIPPGAWHDLLLGEHGLISFGLAGALLTVLPVLSVFFLAFGAIEDTGYLPNMGVLVQRALGRLGLTGASIMPLVLACGCKTMATMATRVLHSRKERIIAVVLIASSIPCAAQTGMHLAILGRTGVGALGIVAAVMLAGFAVAGLVLNRLLPADRPTHFIQALPPMRLPSPRAVLVKTAYRLLWFCREAIPIFVLAAAILYAAEAVGILGALRVALAPLIEGMLGLPPELVDVLVLSIARQEAGAAMLLMLVEQGRLDPGQTVVAVVLALRFVPCFNTVVAMGRELGVGGAATAVVAINGAAFLVAAALRWGLAAAYGLPP